MAEQAQALLLAMAQYDLRPGSIKWDDEIHRFPGPGKGPSNDDGWYIAWSDGRGGAFGDWARGIKETWQYTNGKRPPDVNEKEWVETRRQWAEEEKQKAAEWEARTKAKHEEVAARARERWRQGSTDVDLSHPYLRAKGVVELGAGWVKQEGENLLIAMKAVEDGDPITSLQVIHPDGRKRFMKGSRTEATRTTIGASAFKKTRTIYVCEGWATGWTVHHVTGCATVVAFTCGNLPVVSDALRKRYPDTQIVVCADNDRWTFTYRGGERLANPGVVHAREAAALARAELAIPDFTDLSDRPTDFNDLWLREGRAAVEHWLDPLQAVNARIAPLAAAEEAPPDGTEPGAVILDPKDPYAGAKEFQRRQYQIDDLPTLYDHGGVFYSYDGAAYRERETAAIRSELWTFASQAKAWKKNKKDDIELVPYQPTTSKVSNLLDATRAVSYLPPDRTAPCWLEDRPGDPDPEDLIALPNGVLEIRERRLHPATPRFFSHHALGFPYEAQPGAPTRWLEFLSELWTNASGNVDEQSIAALQEMFGYFLLPDTRQQKLFLVVGPKRSGKGTIGRVLSALLGHANVCAPTLSSLSTNFGLWPLMGKLLAIISDARLGSRADQAAIAERLLSISGEDALTIDRKHLPPWTGKLPTRFMILTNELPRVQDSSGALASRFLVLTLSQSFYGREDPDLTQTLLRELPRIFVWALDGLDRLRGRGHFSQPDSSRDAITELEDLGSPISAFVRDGCVLGPGQSVATADLYQEWRRWCATQGLERPGTIQSFGANLRAILPGLQVRQPRQDGERIRVYDGIAPRRGAGS